MCENKILFHELISHRSHELTKIALDSKNPTCIAILSGTTPTPSSGSTDDTFLAIGCSDGTIRLISFTTFKVHPQAFRQPVFTAVFVQTVVRLGYKSPPVTCLKSLHTSQTTTLLVSGSQEGTLCLWDPFPTVSASGASLPPITTVSKAHDGEVVSISIGFSSPHSNVSGIFTLGRSLPSQTPSYSAQEHRWRSFSWYL